MTENAAQRAQAPEEATHSHLSSSSDFAHKFAPTLFHNEVHKYFTWTNGNKTWQRRKKEQPILEEVEIRSSDALGRVYTVHQIQTRISKKVCLSLSFQVY
ncbi:hypothetical protein AVEN_229925-1 [Araneus ventricosus]|uniref:Uncharacterized protein n=1 Tax=Araneus ventricosus TaxID=182803 RepID=A0A4Y2BX24_ARAVE|nr:hypothetical protein AVEN_229925-1 [Araneus ventricosus]